MLIFLPQLSIKCAPCFDYRSVMADVARNFHSLDGKNWLTYADSACPNVKGEVFIRSVSATGANTSCVTSLK
ncbi:hypothetical protein BZG82_15920 [Salinivibrio sp. PR5]|uniref:hypothetical protein n=1 Tax=Salinivibrio sp. PR5 TaxID=1909484 RepID=UPI00098B6C6C|nr:hypothetical protein [Salinivibrio sp. PR5]OOF07908.1 hypothetical protein BZG82_15920 [Salinivibrio sp. PR5]